MGAFDDVRNEAEGALNDIPPEQRQKIEQIAQEKGIPIDQAKEHFFNSQNNDPNQDQPQQQNQGYNQNQQQSQGSTQGQQQDMDRGEGQGQNWQSDQDRDEREEM